MGYNCKIKTDSIIDIQDVQDIVDNLPAHLSAPFGNTKQMWGWSTGADLYLPEGNTITVGGTYSISGNIAEEYVDFLKQKLELKGYEHIITEWSY